MKVKIVDDGLIIVPETDFEDSYLRNNFLGNSLKAFLKHGLSVKDLIGLKILKGDGKIDPPDEA
jgi:hypothetical protein